MVFVHKGGIALVAASLCILFPPGVITAAVSATPAQTFLGVGGSGAWWPHDLFNFPDSVRQNLSSLLFSQAGLGLSNYRYNIGGGGVNVSNPVRAPETFYVSPGVYNWSADPQGIYFLQQAAAHGVPSLTAFVNSAPAAMTSGHASCNGAFVNGTGLEYGTYIADVISHWRAAGLMIGFISPMNEPDNNFGPSPCGQEGMMVSANQRAEVINGVYSALQTKGLQNTVGILADESSSLSLATSVITTWLPSVIDKARMLLVLHLLQFSILSQVAALVHHTYDFPTDASYLSYVNNVQMLFPGKATWMSEICCSLGSANGAGRGWSGGYDPTIGNALMFAGLVFQSFVLAGEPHYDASPPNYLGYRFWTLVSNQLGCSPLTSATCATTPNDNGWTDGMIYYDPSYATNKNFNLYLTKHFWTYKHFGNFVKPGTQRRPLTGSDVQQWMMAVSTPMTYSVLAMNPNATDSTLSLTFPDAVCALSAFRTSATEDFVTMGAATRPATGAAWLLPLKAMSLTTFTFDRGAC
ncbi:glycoside hydrolase family 5 protein [Mycena rosella]|uniref:Glycoside hydrolase family 5 protein n=1 Tax=Mycena rosella TaxID=1033263 RepID=A0AAD7DJG0_MYCRO|nr:glycoside hydrolase family 5 protein [Mycena rosella]